MKLKNVIYGLLGVLFVGVLAHLAIPSVINFRNEEIKVIVEEVRVLTISEKKSEAKAGHPVVGAVVGGLIAKTPGAIIGAMVGNSVGGDGLSKVEVPELLGCTVIVRLPDQKTVPLRFGRDEILYRFRQLVPASLLRKGDTITIVRRINKKNGEILWYEWMGK